MKRKQNKRSKRIKIFGIPKDDTYLDENSTVVLDDVRVEHPTRDDMQEVISDLSGLREWEQEARGNNLTFGDY